MPQTAEASITSSCVNPQGEIIADYATGIHGIVGNPNTFTGSDKVYKNKETGDVTQCFCPTNGQGIQTNWIKTNQLSQDEIKQYEAQGWIYIPVGSDWGLDNVPYLAKNSNYTCLATAIVQSTSVTNNNSTTTNTTNNNTTNIITALANTGNIVFIYAVLGIGLTSLLIGLYLRNASK